jgi:hypothetical protein
LSTSRIDFDRTASMLPTLIAMEYPATRGRASTACAAPDAR